MINYPLIIKHDNGQSPTDGFSSKPCLIARGSTVVLLSTIPSTVILSGSIWWLEEGILEPRDGRSNFK